MNNIIKAGYRITVTSWENDADSYNTKTLEGLTLEDAKFTVDFINLFTSQNNRQSPGIGNMYDPSEDEIKKANQAVADVMKKHGRFIANDFDGDYQEYWWEIAYELGLSGGDFFTRVMESFVVEYIPEDIVIKNVTGEFE